MRYLEHDIKGRAKAEGVIQKGAEDYIYNKHIQTYIMKISMKLFLKK
jgi:hypothetical protein